jgi:hypothetical protein
VVLFDRSTPLLASTAAASAGGSAPGFRRARPAAAALLGALATLDSGPGLAVEPFSGDRQRRKLEFWPEWMPDPEMTPPTLTAITSRLNNTYTGYSIGCAAVWAVLLATGRGLLDAKRWDMLRLGAAGWWTGWLSASIARVGFPPPRKLTEAGQRRLEKVSLVLVLLGFVNFFRLLITGRRRAGGTADRSN